jgi:hypothetical protein
MFEDLQETMMTLVVGGSCIGLLVLLGYVLTLG